MEPPCESWRQNSQRAIELINEARYPNNTWQASKLFFPFAPPFPFPLFSTSLLIPCKNNHLLPLYLSTCRLPPSMANQIEAHFQSHRHTSECFVGSSSSREQTACWRGPKKTSQKRDDTQCYANRRFYSTPSKFKRGLNSVAMFGRGRPTLQCKSAHSTKWLLVEMWNRLGRGRGRGRSVRIIYPLLFTFTWALFALLWTIL